MIDIGDEELLAIKRVLESKRLFRYQGPSVSTECSRFEQQFADFIGTPFSLTVTSGTNALVCALTAAGIGPGDEVMVPAYTFFATVSAVLQVKAIPVIVNIDQSLGVDPLECVQRLNSKTKAIIAVHMDGLNCNLDPIKKICDEHNLILVEDCAQALGGSYFGKRLGSIGHFGCFSFNQEKNMTAGEGGAVTTNTRSYYERSLCIHDSGCSFGPTMKSEFQNVIPFVGMSMRVSELTAAILAVQLKRLKVAIPRLLENKSGLIKSLNKAGIQIIQSADPAGDCGTTVHVVCDDPFHAQQISRSLLKDGFANQPIGSRLGHSVWQWLPMLKDRRFSHPSADPFSNLTPQQFSELRYEKHHYLRSTELTLRVLRIPLSLSSDQSDFKNLLKSVLKAYNFPLSSASLSC